MSGSTAVSVTKAMGELARKIIKQIETATTPVDLNDCVWIAGDLLFKLKATYFHSGFEEIDREEVTEAECDQIKQALLGLLNRISDPGCIGSIIQALGKSHDESLKELYVSKLAEHLKKLLAHNFAVYSALYALDGMGEDVYGDTPSQGTTQVDQNIRQARKYLETHNVILPW